MGKRVNTAQWMENQQRWQIKVQKDNERKTFYSSKPGRTGQREANAKADAWLDENISNTNKRVEPLWNSFLASLLSKDEYKKADSVGKCYILPAIGKKQIGSLTEGDFQKILDKGAKKGKNGKPLSKKTLMNMASIMQRFMKYCRKNKLTKEILEDLSVPKNAYTKEKKILQPNDIITLFTKDTIFYRGREQKDNYIHAYRFEVLTGLRPGEIIGLNKQDVQGNDVRILRSVNERGEITKGKNQNAERQFSLTKFAKQELESAMQSSASESVFEIQSQSTYRHRWKRYCEYNNIPYITPYEMRHTFISIAKNLSAGEIRALVGHSKSMDSWGVYGHEVQGERRRIAKKLEDIFSEIVFTEESKK